MEKISKNVFIIRKNPWDWFLRSDKAPYDITGKYLFFSTDRNVLIQIAVDEIQNNGFHRAKVNSEGENQSPDYVLCLYYSGDSRKNELAEKYRSRKDLRYRYWKSDEDTLKGKYSKKFLNQLSEKDKIMFTQPKVKNNG